MEDLRLRWDDLTGWMGDGPREQWWGRIKENYSQSHRHYHTFDHLNKLFQLYDEFKEALKDKVCVAFAIFFHDIAYNPKAPVDNEKKSVEIFQEFAKETALSQTGVISDLILATESHCTDAHGSDDFGTDDIHYLLDFDMAILGSSPEEYKVYKEQIRKEYAHFSDDEYNNERSKVLKLFSQIPHIYATQAFREQYEELAKKNIREEIAELSA